MFVDKQMESIKPNIVEAKRLLKKEEEEKRKVEEEKLKQEK
jgi:hypothetical protein